MPIVDKSAATKTPFVELNRLLNFDPTLPLPPNTPWKDLTVRTMEHTMRYSERKA